METPAEYATQEDNLPIPVRDARTEKRFFVDNIIIRGYGPTLGVYGVAVYTALCMHANITTQSCYPSHRTIADQLDCSVNKVRDSIRLLEKLKLIETAPRYDAKNQRQTSNLYTLLDPPPITTDPPHTTDTRPQYREMTTNNPHSDQSYLNKEPAAPDSPPADDSLDDAPLPRMPTSTERIRVRVTPVEDSWPDDRPPPKPTTPRTKEQHKAGILKAVKAFEQNGPRAGVADPTKDGAVWSNGPVNAWCKIAKKDASQLTDGTRYKLAGIFRDVGAITDSTPAQIATAIEQFPFEYEWWAKKVGFEWPSDSFCNRLGMLLVPDAPPEPINLDNPSGDSRPIRL